MKSRLFSRVTPIALGFCALGTVASGPVAASNNVVTYRATIQNLAAGQPMSPPVAATHRGAISMFKVGKLASTELEAIAEDGNSAPMFDLFDQSGKVTDVVDVGAPLTPNGTMVGPFTDAVTFEIEAKRGDKLSLATMLICTNDGFTGISRGGLPSQGNKVFLTNGYDAGTEDNTELSSDIVDPCSALGPILLTGDPNGNEDLAVDSVPHNRISHHPNIAEAGDLVLNAHGWMDPVSKVTLTRIDAHADKFLSRLSGVAEVPLVESDASGRFRAWLGKHQDVLEFKLHVQDISGVVQAHIHFGLPNENGPVVAFLFGPAAPTGSIDGRLSRGTLTKADLLGPFAGDFDGFVAALRSGELYINVHTAAVPSGELRGQVGVRD